MNSILRAAIMATVLIIAGSPAFANIKCDRFGCHSANRSADTVKHRTKATRAAPTDANGNTVGLIKSAKTGATARVAPRYRAMFQAYIDDLEAAGASIRFIGGIRAGRCSIPRHKHPCGMAVDVCQTGRGRIDPRCNLPGRRYMARIAARHGLLEGGVWCNSDYGHAEVRTARQALGCRRNLYTAIEEFHHRGKRHD